MSTLTRPPATPPRVPARLPRPAVTGAARVAEVLRGLLAVVLLLAVAAGVPLALWQLIGNPFPTTVPTRSWLDAELSVTAVLDVLAVVLWTVWAHFLVCVAAEFRTWGRGGAAGRIPFGGANQVFAQRLVAAVLLLAAGAVSVPGSVVPGAPVAVVSSTPATATTSTSETGAARTATTTAPDASWSAVPAATGTRAAAPLTYVVEPPQGRHHDCLWDIAERTLGDPLRYQEIFELNRDRVQPDGSRLVDADLIRPGWVLLLPADAVGAGTAPVVSVAPVVADGAVPDSTVDDPAADDPAADDTAADDTAADDTAADDTAADDTAADDTAADDTAADDTASGGSAAEVTVSGGLLLAGVVAAMSGRTRPDDETLTPLRGDADPGRAAFLDRALRSLAAARAAAGHPLPDVVAAHLSGDDLVLHLRTTLTGPAAAPPVPWTDLDGVAWRVLRADLAGHPDAGDAPAPYPTLVDVAVDGTHDVLLDLESAPGIIAVGGYEEFARDVVTSMATELATNSWSDGVDVHLVGFGDELSALVPGNLHAHPLLDPVLDIVEARSPRGTPDLLVGRLDRSPDSLRPSVIAVSGRPTDEQVRRLTALTAGGRTSVAVVCVGDVPSAARRFAVDAAGTLDLGVLGLSGTARRLPPADYAPWLAALRAAL